MTKRERIMAAIEGRPYDRIPYSLWYHFRLDPPAGPNMAKAELDFYHKYDPDLLKVMHDIPYEMPKDMPLVRSIEDWAKLDVLDGVSGNFGKQLDTLKMIIAEKGDDGPVIDTVFSIFSTAEKVCGKRTLEFLRQDKTAVHAGLEKITKSLANYAKALVEAGVDGIYLAVSGAATDTMPLDEYRENFMAYDQQILDAARAAKVNVLHHHGSGIYPEVSLQLTGYHILCWSDRLPGNLSLKEMRLKTTHCLMGGVNETTFGADTPESILSQIKDAIFATNGQKFIVGPGCAVPTPPDSPDENLRTFRKGVLTA
jgi:uroporphyrinogen decarboxylase